MTYFENSLRGCALIHLESPRVSRAERVTYFEYTVLESNQRAGLRRPSAASVGRCRVKVEGFEPAASRSHAERSTKLSYTLFEPVKVGGFEPTPSR